MDHPVAFSKFASSPELTPSDEWLFDLSTDPNETSNVADHYPDVVTEMKAMIEAEAPGIVSFTLTGRCDSSEVSADGVWLSGCCA